MKKNEGNKRMAGEVDRRFKAHEYSIFGLVERINASCIWQRKGYAYPDNQNNYWKTSCGCDDYGKLAKGLCPHCARPVQARTLEVGE